MNSKYFLALGDADGTGAPHELSRPLEVLLEPVKDPLVLYFEACLEFLGDLDSWQRFETLKIHHGFWVSLLGTLLSLRGPIV